MKKNSAFLFLKSQESIFGTLPSDIKPHLVLIIRMELHSCFLKLAKEQFIQCCYEKKEAVASQVTTSSLRPEKTPLFWFYSLKHYECSKVIFVGSVVVLAFNELPLDQDLFQLVYAPPILHTEVDSTILYIQQNANRLAK